jgi:hypothetical protein
MPLKRYLTNCTVQGNGSAITAMIDVAREITRKTFLKHVDRASLVELERSLGYAAHPRQGLTLAGDYHVQYAKSTFRGRPCVYLTWSCIEYVFV